MLPTIGGFFAVLVVFSKILNLFILEIHESSRAS